MNVRGRHFEVVGHRGSGHQPENTMSAFKQGVKDGADRIEFDIRRTADGHYVVMHDRELDRTTNGTGNVDEVTLDYIQTLDAGDGAPPPTFQQVIDWSKAEDVALDIEIKAGESDEIVEILEEADLKKPWVKSFEHGLIAEIEEARPELVTGVLVKPKAMLYRLGLGAALGAAAAAVAGPFLGVGALLAAGVGAGLGLLAGYERGTDATFDQSFNNKSDIAMPHHRLVTKRMTRRAEECGRTVVPWTVDRPKDGERLKKKGVAGIITNFPDLFRV